MMDAPSQPPADQAAPTETRLAAHLDTPGADGMTLRERLFVHRVAQGMPPQIAADSLAIRDPYTVMHRPHVAEALDDAYKPRGMRPPELLARISTIARGPQHMIKVNAETEQPYLDWKAAAEHGEMACIKKVKWRKGLPEVEFHDSVHALEVMARVHGLLKDTLISQVTHGVDPSVSRAIMAEALTHNPQLLERMIQTNDEIRKTAEKTSTFVEVTPASP